jgi:PDZ domain-containing protein
MKFPNAALGLALAGVSLLAVPGPARAEDAPRDQIERLMPQLMSKDEAARRDAEKQILMLGPAGRSELERIAAEEDLRRAVTALRLLSRGRWADRPAERAMGSDADMRRADELSTRIRNELEDLQRRMAEFAPGFAPLPTGPEFVWPDGRTVRARASGELVESDRRMSWTISEDGSVKVIAKDKDAPERTVEAKNLAQLREKAPDLATRLEAVLPGAARRLAGALPPEGPGDRIAERVPPAAQQPILGIEWSPIPEVLGDQLGVKNGLVVESVVGGTLAEKLGLQRHDVLLELNGNAVNGSEDVRTLLDAAKAGDKVSATVLRGGQRKSLDAVK